MKNVKMAICAAVVCLIAVGGVSMADSFGTGENQFEIDFVNISGDSGNLGNWPAGSGYTFSGVNHGSYRMGKFEITNDQWNKFKISLGVSVRGIPSNAYDQNPYWKGTNVPTNNVSWYEAAQFVNWLNTSSGKSAAYKFNGTQGTSGYSLEVWQSGDNGYDASNPYRNSNAFYFLPTENEWVKAAYWNGTSLQEYATKAGESLYQGNGSNGGWNYDYYTMRQPWAVGSGSEELNGTFDMMGNVWEWMESPYYTGDYTSGSYRGRRGGYYRSSLGTGSDDTLSSAYRDVYYPYYELDKVLGFRVASVPEPATLLLLGLGGLFLRRKH